MWHDSPFAGSMVPGVIDGKPVPAYRQELGVNMQLRNRDLRGGKVLG